MTISAVRVFENIVVLPTQAILGPGLRGAFRGGPVWPVFALQVHARHCRGRLPVPRDRRPRPDAEPRRAAETGIWCGPVCAQFGHMVADFGMRIAPSAAQADADVPLVFSIGPDLGAEPPAFFWQILDALGVARERVLLVREPTRFRRLCVLPQAERLHGGPPSARHLDLMDALAGRRHGPAEPDVRCLFVSRALYPDGRLAAEDYLGEVLERAGVRVIFPETMTVAEQLSLYRRAETIVFSEGSAIHAVQLLGRIAARVAILVRRPGTRIAEPALRARAASLAYLDGVRGLACGLHPSGRRFVVRALSVIDPPRLLAGLRGVGIDLAAVWEPEIFAERSRADLLRWVAYVKFWNHHPGSPAAMQASLDALGIDIRVDDVAAARLGAAGAAPTAAVPSAAPLV